MTTKATVMMPTSFSLEMSVDAGTTYNEVKEVRNFDPGNIEADELDVTSFTSPSDWRAFAFGLKQANDGSFEVNFLIDDTQHKALRDAVGSATPIKLKATMTAANADDEVLVFDALIKSMSRPVEIGGVLVATIGFKMTGAPTYS